MKNKKGNVVVIAIIVVIVAVTAGVVGWMFAKKSQAPAPQVVATQPTTPVTQMQPTVSQQPKADDSAAQIQMLSAKWAQSGLTQWEKKELLNSGVVGIFPIDSKIFKITTTKDKSLHSTELGNLIGQISVPYVSDDKLFGNTTQISTNQITDGQTLESWVNQTGVTVHQNYCKKYGTEDMRYPGNKTCITKISISKKVNDNVIFWNTDFIGSPDILSVLVGKTVVSFELSQDISQGKVNFEEFMQDTALTLQPKQLDQ